MMSIIMAAGRKVCKITSTIVNIRLLIRTTKSEMFHLSAMVTGCTVGLSRGAIIFAKSVRMASLLPLMSFHLISSCNLPGLISVAVLAILTVLAVS